MDSLELISAERKKQLERWGNAHDDEHTKGELLEAAYDLLYAIRYNYSQGRWDLPQKYKDPDERLVIVAALLSAEIDRRIRLKATKKSS